MADAIICPPSASIAGFPDIYKTPAKSIIDLRTEWISGYCAAEGVWSPVRYKAATHQSFKVGFN